MGRRLCFEALSGIPEVRPGDALAALIVAALVFSQIPPSTRAQPA